MSLKAFNTLHSHCNACTIKHFIQDHMQTNWLGKTGQWFFKNVSLLDAASGKVAQTNLEETEQGQLLRTFSNISMVVFSLSMVWIASQTILAGSFLGFIKGAIHFAIALELFELSHGAYHYFDPNISQMVKDIASKGVAQGSSLTKQQKELREITRNIGKILRYTFALKLFVPQVVETGANLLFAKMNEKA